MIEKNDKLLNDVTNLKNLVKDMKEHFKTDVENMRRELVLKADKEHLAEN